jgi:hypothetical protein
MAIKNTLDWRKGESNWEKYGKSIKSKNVKHYL